MRYWAADQAATARLYDAAGVEVTDGQTFCWISLDGGPAVQLVDAVYVAHSGWVAFTGDRANTRGAVAAISWENAGALALTREYPLDVGLIGKQLLANLTSLQQLGFWQLAPADLTSGTLSTPLAEGEVFELWLTDNEWGETWAQDPVDNARDAEGNTLGPDENGWIDFEAAANYCRKRLARVRGTALGDVWELNPHWTLPVDASGVLVWCDNPPGTLGDRTLTLTFGGTYQFPGVYSWRLGTRQWAWLGQNGETYGWTGYSAEPWHTPQVLGRLMPQTPAAATGSGATLVLPAMPAQRYSQVSTAYEVELVRGDGPLTLPVDLGTDCNGFDAWFAGKASPSDTAYTQSPRLCTWVDQTAGTLTVPISALDLATAGRYRVEIELRAGAAKVTARIFTLRVTAGVMG